MCGNWKVRNCELRTANCAVDVMMDVNEEGTRDIGVGNVHSGGRWEEWLPWDPGKVFREVEER